MWMSFLTGLSQKLAGYFRLPSVQHYLIVDPLQPSVVHHSRGADAIVTRIVTEGRIALDRPASKSISRTSTTARNAPHVKYLSHITFLNRSCGS